MGQSHKRGEQERRGGEKKERRRRRGGGEEEGRRRIGIGRKRVEEYSEVSGEGLADELAECHGTLHFFVIEYIVNYVNVPTTQKEELNMRGKNRRRKWRRRKWRRR